MHQSATADHLLSRLPIAFPARTTMHHSATDSDLRLKVSRISYQQKQLKIAFNQLKSQITTGLLEADDVLASLAVPLMKLVGLKSVELSEEGRFSSIIINNNDGANPNFSDWPRNRDNSEEESGRSELAICRADTHQTTGEFESFKAKATQACKELMHKQKVQLVQLVQLLQQIEIQVNSSKDDILQSLTDHRASLQKLFQKAVTFVHVIHKSQQSNGTSPDTVKLLKFMFEHFGSVLGSVEISIENLICNLADKMCHPMVKYVNCLKGELVTGTCQSLLATLEEMEGAIRLRSLELEEARKKVKAVEESRLNALYRLKESEAKLKEMMEWQNFSLEAHIRSRGHPDTEKLSCEEVDVDPAKDETLLWELLRKKRKLQVPDSPLGEKELQGIVTNSRNLMSSRVIPPIRLDPASRNRSVGLSPIAPRMDFRVPLGSSPSTRSPQVLQLLPRKRIRP